MSLMWNVLPGRLIEGTECGGEVSDMRRLTQQVAHVYSVAPSATKPHTGGQSIWKSV